MGSQIVLTSLSFVCLRMVTQFAAHTFLYGILISFSSNTQRWNFMQCEMNEWMNATRIRCFYSLCLLIQRHAQNEIFGASNNWFRSVSAAVVVVVVVVVTVLFDFYPKKGSTLLWASIKAMSSSSIQFIIWIWSKRLRHWETLNQFIEEKTRTDLAVCLRWFELCQILAAFKMCFSEWNWLNNISVLKEEYSSSFVLNSSRK